MPAGGPGTPLRPERRRGRRGRSPSRRLHGREVGLTESVRGRAETDHQDLGPGQGHLGVVLERPGQGATCSSTSSGTPGSKNCGSPQCSIFSAPESTVETWRPDDARRRDRDQPHAPVPMTPIPREATLHSQVSPRGPGRLELKVHKLQAVGEIAESGNTAQPLLST
jgi:hypothetical protein